MCVSWNLKWSEETYLNVFRKQPDTQITVYKPFDKIPLKTNPIYNRFYMLIWNCKIKKYYRKMPFIHGVGNQNIKYTIWDVQNLILWT